MIPIVAELIWHTIGIDWTGPMTPTKKGNMHIICAIDYYSNYLIGKAAKDSTAFTTAKFIFSEIICKHGLFYKLISDQGKCFESQLIEELFKLLKVKRVRSSPYHPMSNGKIERINKTIKSMLKNYCNEFHDDWDEFLDQVIFAYNIAVHSSTGVSPFEMMFNRTPRDVDSLMFAEELKFFHNSNYPAIIHERQRIKEIVKNALTKSDEHKIKYYNAKLNERYTYNVGDWVWITDPTMKTGQTKKLTPMYKGPYIIQEISNDNVNYTTQRRKRPIKDSSLQPHQTFYFARAHLRDGRSGPNAFTKRGNQCPRHDTTSEHHQ